VITILDPIATDQTLYIFKLALNTTPMPDEVAEYSPQNIFVNFKED